VTTRAEGGAGVPGFDLRFLRDGVAARTGCPPKPKAGKELWDDQATEHRLTPLPRCRTSSRIRGLFSEK
jgi:hypothetical protein